MAKAKSKVSEPLFQGLDLEQMHGVETISEDKAEKYVFETVDFNDPARPQTCLEVDFPILKVNEVASVETNAIKPIYMMSKWWARRRSSVFRQILIAAATKSPKRAEDAAQAAWGLMYRKKHQAHGKFKSLKVVDIFMGGGTTVVEAARLGFQTIGVDINPIAWWVVKNQVETTSPEEVDEFYNFIESKVKTQIMPFFTAKSPRKNVARWVDAKSGEPTKVDPISLAPEERCNYRWEGPEAIYTFWIKHILCCDPACNHLTPQINSPVVATKELKLKSYENCVCSNCGEVFDLEVGEFRMAPTAKFVIGKDEKPFAAIDIKNGTSKCPHCNKNLTSMWIDDQIKRKGKAKSKSASHSLLLPKKWLKGIGGPTKEYYGGYFGSSNDQDERWFADRAKDLRLIEVRGEISSDLLHSNFSQKIKSDTNEGGSSGKIKCGGCGRIQDPLGSIKLSGKLAPLFPYMIQGVDPEDKKAKQPYNGRFFDLPDFPQVFSSFLEFKNLDILQLYVPQEELFVNHQTHSWGVPDHGYTHWYKMFNPRQLYVNALLLKTIVEAPDSKFSAAVKSQVLGGWQNYLRHNCMFSIWDVSRDGLAPHFSNNNYHPKALPIENGVFSDLGRGNFKSCIENVVSGLSFSKAPYDLQVTNATEGAKSLKVQSDDLVIQKNVELYCQSSTNLKYQIQDSSVDLVITDPPFGDNLNYSELADFFMVWLHKGLKGAYPKEFGISESPKSLEAVANKLRHPGNTPDGKRNADVMYDRLLTLAWREAARILRPAGILAFTFHHDNDIAWIGVLESLFNAGFNLEATYPVRSDSSKGKGQFGSRKIEYDIIHVCRKRLSEPTEVYWATLRKKIFESVRSKAYILAQHKESGLHLADLEVVIRGEVLEQYSRHYGKVKKNLAGDLISVKEILIEANAIALILLESSDNEKLPEGLLVETSTLFSLFRQGPSIERNAASKRLKGSGISLDDLEESGWVKTVREDGQRIASLVNPLERWTSLSRKTRLVSDIDQVHFAINCCVGGRTIQDKPADFEQWLLDNYKTLLPTVGPILKYIETNHFGSDYKQAIGIAYRTLERTLQRLKETDGEFKKASDQMSLFGD